MTATITPWEADANDLRDALVSIEQALDPHTTAARTELDNLMDRLVERDDRIQELESEMNDAHERIYALEDDRTAS